MHQDADLELSKTAFRQFFRFFTTRGDPYDIGWLKVEHGANTLYSRVDWTGHCESGEGLWLQGEAAIQMHIFGDADPQSVIPKNQKKSMQYPTK